MHDAKASYAGGQGTLVDFRGDPQTTLAATNTITPKTVEILALPKVRKIGVAKRAASSLAAASAI